MSNPPPLPPSEGIDAEGRDYASHIEAIHARMAELEVMAAAQNVTVLDLAAQLDQTIHQAQQPQPPPAINLPALQVVLASAPAGPRAAAQNFVTHAAALQSRFQSLSSTQDIAYDLGLLPVPFASVHPKWLSDPRGFQYHATRIGGPAFGNLVGSSERGLTAAVGEVAERERNGVPTPGSQSSNANPHSSKSDHGETDDDATIPDVNVESYLTEPPNTSGPNGNAPITNQPPTGASFDAGSTLNGSAYPTHADENPVTQDKHSHVAVVNGGAGSSPIACSSQSTAVSTEAQSAASQSAAISAGATHAGLVAASTQLNEPTTQSFASSSHGQGRSRNHQLQSPAVDNLQSTHSDDGRPNTARRRLRPLASRPSTPVASHLAVPTPGSFEQNGSEPVEPKLGNKRARAELQAPLALGISRVAPQHNQRAPVPQAMPQSQGQGYSQRRLWPPSWPHQGQSQPPSNLRSLQISTEANLMPQTPQTPQTLQPFVQPPPQVRPAALPGLEPEGGLPLVQSQVWTGAMRGHLRMVTLYISGQKDDRTFVVRVEFRNMKTVRRSEAWDFDNYVIDTYEDCEAQVSRTSDLDCTWYSAVFRGPITLWESKSINSVRPPVAVATQVPQPAFEDYRWRE
ncbi:hypothetical protein A1Q1_04985 [Trichosporon asahii var. asahii CBS 2479]|uniref:Uncharacterized protein n=1 Tax=Trichosporon asahii var. asahii (strain ATCC 90039 / CBS 2479 / JCM 2466 / KCTC 7840 / NBRC 103889/ NCYC 2677 / UAMH 7654) TaxID=1186058 RepID=J5QAG0_TRIAS|nr:hypothetical protein A1Q1_04985 [Trichosporon asahii var. asahii CBS 2479]EJT46338.1 hypothetical protein A1Q1_04985 [Trichosporon asahii var. asahii CBS 2479]